MEGLVSYRIALISAVPALFGLTYYIFKFSLLKKLVLTALTMSYLSLFLPVQVLRSGDGSREIRTVYADSLHRIRIACGHPHHPCLLLLGDELVFGSIRQEGIVVHYPRFRGARFQKFRQRDLLIREFVLLNERIKEYDERMKKSPRKCIRKWPCSSR